MLRSGCAPTPARQATLEAMRRTAQPKSLGVALLVAALALVPSQGFGWGRDGHSVVANLAQSRLSPAARRGVAALLHGATLASVSTYADNYRNNHPETARWHFVNIPLGDGHYNPARDCTPSPEGDCIIAAIERFSAILANPSPPQDERAEALKFLVHFVADLHQPLHAANKNDRGGNDTQVTFFGEPTNLHAVWDYGLMEHTGFTVTAWTDLLNRSGLSGDGRGTPVQWAEESVRVAAQHAYLLPTNRELGQAYFDANLPVLKQQLFRGGVRLAALLNAIFEQAAAR